MSHTTTLWIDDGPYIRDGNGNVICTVSYEGIDRATFEATRKLLFAAPELLEACELALEYLRRTGSGPECQNAISELGYVINKARLNIS